MIPYYSVNWWELENTEIAGLDSFQSLVVMYIQVNQFERQQLICPSINHCTKQISTGSSNPHLLGKQISNPSSFHLLYSRFRPRKVIIVLATLIFVFLLYHDLKEYTVLNAMNNFLTKGTAIQWIIRGHTVQGGNVSLILIQSSARKICALKFVQVRKSCHHKMPTCASFLV